MTKEQWLELWKATRKIEDKIKLIPPTGPNGLRHTILVEVRTIKQLIQSEIGQLE